jgi:uncharacterized membrane protein
LRIPILVAIAAYALSGSQTAFGVAAGWAFMGLVLLKGIGLGITGILLSYEFARKEGLVNKVCGSNGGCQRILQSKASKLLGLVSWSELGFLYFARGGCCCYSWVARRACLKALNYITLTFSIYSILYQGAAAKQWCYFCLGTLALFWLEFAALYGTGVSWAALSNMPELYLAGMAFALPLGLWLVMKPLLTRSSHLDYFEPNFKKLKYNPHVLRSLINESEQVSHSAEFSPLQFGSPNSDLQITIVSNPFCGPCADAHRQVDHLIERFEEEGGVGISLVFGVGRDASTEKYQVARDMINLYRRFGSKASMRAISNWYAMPKKDYTAWREKYNPPNSPSADDILAQHQQWREDNGLDKPPPSSP